MIADLERTFGRIVLVRDPHIDCAFHVSCRRHHLVGLIEAEKAYQFGRLLPVCCGFAGVAAVRRFQIRVQPVEVGRDP